MQEKQKQSYHLSSINPLIYRRLHLSVYMCVIMYPCPNNNIVNKGAPNVLNKPLWLCIQVTRSLLADWFPCTRGA